MKITRNYLQEANIPDFVLTKANGERLGVIPCTSKDYTKHFDSPDEVTFTTYFQYDSVQNPYYDQIQNMQYIEVLDIGRFIIQSVEEHSDGADSTYKSVTCKDISVLLSQRYLDTFTVNYGTIESIDGVQFYKLGDTEHSLLHLVVSELFPAWSFGHIDPELMTVVRSFEVTKQDVYSFLMDDVANAFECKFTFDTLNYQINAYSNANVGVDTNIHVSYNNLLKNTDITCSTDDIKTSLILTGDDDVSIREIARGNDRIYNLNWFNSTEYWSQSLYDAYNTWQTLTYGTPVNWNYLRYNLVDESGSPYFVFDNTRDLDGNYVMNYTDIQNQYQEFLRMAGMKTVQVYTSGQNSEGTITSNGYADNEVWTRVVTIPGATSIRVHYKVRTESTTWDWACIWEGNHPEYTAIANNSTAIGGKLGGTTLRENTITINGNTVTIAFKSDSSNCNYYGFWAEITSASGSGTYSDNYNNLYTFLLAKYQNYYCTLSEWSSTKIPAGNNARYFGYGTYPIGYPNNIDTENESTFTIDRYTSVSEITSFPSIPSTSVLYLLNNGSYGMYRYYQGSWINTNLWSDMSLSALNEKLKSAENNQAVAMKNGYGTRTLDTLFPTTQEVERQEKNYVTYYLPYYYAIQSLNKYISECQTKIDNCTAYQDRIGRALSGIAYYTDMTTNFTTDQLKELSKFIREDELNSSNYVVTDVMTEQERFEMLNSLLSYGENELAKVAQPQFKFSVGMVNIFALSEYDKYVGDFDTGNYIYVTFRNDYSVRATLTELHWDFYDPDAFSVTFGNVLRKTGQGVLSDIAAMAKEAHSMATSVSFNASHWSQAAKKADSTTLALQEGLTKAGYVLTDGTGTEAVWDERGLFLNTNDTNQDGSTNPYANDSIFLGGGRILFTDDDWKTVSTAIGRVDIHGQSTFGVLAKAVLAGYIEGSEFVGGSIRSTNYTYSSGWYSNTGTLIDLSNGVFRTPNFAITSNGNAYYKGTGEYIQSETIGTDQIALSAITTDRILVGAITETRIAGNAVTTGKIATSAVVADKIAASAVVADKIAANAVTTDKINANAITADKISANAVTTDKINANAITADKISANAVTTDKINANAITTAKLATNAITSTNYQDANGNYSSQGTKLDLSNGVIKSKKFGINTSGDAYFKGEITAESGSIGGFTIGSDKIYGSNAEITPDHFQAGSWDHYVTMNSDGTFKSVNGNEGITIDGRYLGGGGYGESATNRIDMAGGSPNAGIHIRGYPYVVFSCDALKITDGYGRTNVYEGRTGTYGYVDEYGNVYHLIFQGGLLIGRTDANGNPA